MTTEQLTALGISQEEWDSFGPYEKMFLDISQVLSENVTDLRWIDIEAGQLEIPEENYPVQFPCSLIDFVQMEASNELLGNQQLDMFIQVRLGLDLYEDLHMVDGKDAPDRGTALKRLNLITRIHKVLHGFETDYSTPLVRTSITTERRDDGIKVFALIYACAAKDDSAATVVTVQTGTNLKVQRG